MTVLWLNGKITDDSPTSSPHLAPGLLVGDGLFETLAVYDGKPFALTQHFERLSSSSRVLGFPDIDFQELETAVHEALAYDNLVGKAPAPVRRLRVTVWHSSDPTAPLSRSVTVLPGVGPLLGEANTKTASVMTSQFVRNERSALTGHKSTSYAENLYALKAAQRSGHDEAMFFNTVGDLSEGSMTNIVVQLGQELITPALSSGCLPGVTRRLALEWSRIAGLPLREAEPGELTRGIVGNPTALLGTLRNVQRVSTWDGVQIAGGSLIRDLSQLFAAQSKILM